MVKNMRIELRVDEDERELWKAAAEKDGLSISAWLRQLARVETEVAPKMPDREDLGREPEPVKERPAKASVEEARPVGSTPTPSADKDFKQMVARLQAKLPQEQAEEVARKRLGME